jgi:hypothetical protein
MPGGFCRDDGTAVKSFRINELIEFDKRSFVIGSPLMPVARRLPHAPLSPLPERKRGLTPNLLWRRAGEGLFARADFGKVPSLDFANAFAQPPCCTPLRSAHAPPGV